MGVPLAIIHFRLEISITHQLFWVSPFMEPPINGILGYIKTFFINIPIYIYIFQYPIGKYIPIYQVDKETTTYHQNGICNFDIYI